MSISRRPARGAEQMVLGLGAALAAAAIFGAAAILQAVAARRTPPSANLGGRFVLGLLHQPAFYASVGLGLLGFGFHLLALRRIPLFLAQAGISVSLVVTALLAVTLFKDRLSIAEWSAVLAVVLGLAVLAASSGAAGPSAAQGRLTVWVGAGLILVALAGLAVGRREGAGAIALLGTLAGVGFAGVSIAARLVPDLSPIAVLHSPAAYVLVLCGLVAGTLYALALQRGAVTTVTAPMIVMQTVTPAVVGVAVLGDQIRAGWSPAVVLGLVLTVSGAIALSRFEG